MIPLPVKIAYTLFVAVFVPVNQRQYGLLNFLWFSDLAVFLGLGALWLENATLASMATISILLPETAWTLDYLFRLVTGREGVGLCNYMFDKRISRWVRGVSLFHIWLPILLLWMLARLGYDPRAFWFQSLAGLVVVAVSFVVTDPRSNVNWVFGFGEKPQSLVPKPLFAFAVAIGFPVLIYAPTHWLLRSLYRT